MPTKTISAAQFAAAFDLRSNLVAWFLGAGASAASGIPTGYAMIRDFRAQIFCRETNLSKREIDTADPVWIDRIDAFFRQTSLLPPDGDPTEYAKAFEAVYPEARHRRQYIDDAISKGTPCFGHKVLGSLMAAGRVNCVFTTNFDPLVEESAHSANGILPVDDQNRPTVAAIDSADRAMRCLNESDWPLVAKLHGDYQSITIKNTGSELEEQDTRMRHVLVESGKRFGMIFVGYSGRDASIMEALNTVLDGPSPFPNGLYWLTSSVSRLLPAVIEFLDRAQAAGVDVAVVECATFDELAADIIKITDLPQPLLDRVMEGRPTPRLVPVQIPHTKARAFPVLRYSATLSRLRDAYGTSLFGTVSKLGSPFQEGVHLKLEQVDGKWWCGFEPYTFVQLPRQDSSQRTVRRVWSPKKLRLRWVWEPSAEVILPVTGAASDGLRATIGIGPPCLIDMSYYLRFLSNLPNRLPYP